MSESDPVNHPTHYTDVVPGIECIEVVKHFSFTRGNAIKYLWRAGAKGDVVEDLRKAVWYIESEIAELTGARREAAPRALVTFHEVVPEELAVAIKKAVTEVMRTWPHA